jgi:hypothetical protein
MSTTATAASVPGRLARLTAGDGLLRLGLKVDAVVTGANGAAYLALAGVLDSPLGVPDAFLRGIGAFLLAFAAAVWTAGARRRISPVAVEAIIAANVLWVGASLALVIGDLHTPATAGAVWAILQALVVAAFAAVQAAGLRRRS